MFRLFFLFKKVEIRFKMKKKKKKSKNEKENGLAKRQNTSGLVACAVEITWRKGPPAMI